MKTNVKQNELFDKCVHLIGQIKLTFPQSIFDEDCLTATYSHITKSIRVYTHYNTVEFNSNELQKALDYLWFKGNAEVGVDKTRLLSLKAFLSLKLCDICKVLDIQRSDVYEMVDNTTSELLVKPEHDILFDMAEEYYSKFGYPLGNQLNQRDKYNMSLLDYLTADGPRDYDDIKECFEFLLVIRRGKPDSLADKARKAGHPKVR